MSSVDKLKREIGLYYASPASIQQVSLDMLSEVTNNEIELVDATNPFVFLMENSATQASAAILKAESVSRRMYPLLAQSYEDLYPHMSDADYLDRFAVPTKTIISLVIPVNDLMREAVPVDATNSNMVLIPKDTSFTVDGVSWMIHTPIKILIPQNRVIQVTYDFNVTSPLVNNTTNILDYRIFKDSSGDMLIIDMPVEQLKVTSSTLPLSPSTGYNTTHVFEDMFYYVRAYHTLDNEDWRELNVTHSELVYDPNRPTLLARVQNNTLQLTLPEVYRTTGGLGNRVRVDIFTTKGKITMDMGDYGSDDFQGRWVNLDKVSDPYSDPLSKITNMQVYGNSPVVGGRGELGFKEMQNRVIYRSEDVRVSITFEELAFKMKDLGYTLDKAKDTITGRQYYCSRSLPPPSGGVSVNTMGVKHGRVTIDQQRTDTTLSVIDNGSSVTLLGGSVFKSEGGDIHLLSDTDRNALLALNNQELATQLNSARYYYTPLFYVLDKTDDFYSARTYRLDSPVNTQRSFVASHDEVDFSISTTQVDVSREDTSYFVTLSAMGPTGVSDVYCQLVYTAPGGRKFRINAEQTPTVTEDFTVQFELSTTLNIDSSDRIEIINMVDDTGVVSPVVVPLDAEFEAIYFKVLPGVPGIAAIDNRLNLSAYPEGIGLTVETLNVVFGYPLSGLASRARATIKPPVYQTHDVDVPKTYDVDVYARDTNGQLIWTVVNNLPVFTLEHTAGDPVLDENNNPVMLHRVGDVVTDIMGNPTVLSPEELTWEIEPLLLDGRYGYATSVDSLRYKTEILDAIQTYHDDDILAVAPELMSRTEIKFQPTASVGTTEVLADGTVKTTMATDLVFNINYMLTPEAYADPTTRMQLNTTTKETIVDLLRESTFSMGALTQALMDNGGNSVLNATIENPIDGYSMCTPVSANTRFSIASELVVLSTGNLAVSDAVYITYSKEA